MEKSLRNEQDEYLWAKDTAEAIKTQNFAAIDMDALLDEMESTVSRIERTLIATLRDILVALLWEKYTDVSIEEIDAQLILAQLELKSMLNLTPSLRDLMESTVHEAYREASEWVIEEFGIVLPENCPISCDQIIGDPVGRQTSHRRLI